MTNKPRDYIRSDHFLKRFGQRYDFTDVDLSKFELVTKYTTNRYKYPFVIPYFKRKDATPMYLVSKELNMVIPVTITNVWKTVLYINKKNTKESKQRKVEYGKYVR
jgi:hypothetical protein